MEILNENKEPKKKFILPGGQRFYFKVSDLLNAINGHKNVEGNDPRAVSIEYSVQSVYTISWQDSEDQTPMLFTEKRLTQLDNISSNLNQVQPTSFICVDTLAVRQKFPGAENNVPHNIYDAGFKITIGETEPIWLKPFVVNDGQGSYSLGLYYVGDGKNDDWRKNVSGSEFALPIYWDKDEAKRTISLDNLSKAKVNLQIVENKDPNEISEAKINEFQAMVRCSDTGDKNDVLFLFAESDKYLYKEENIPTDKNNNKKSWPTSWLKSVGKFVLIPVLIFLLTFFVIKVAIVYAIIYTVLSTIAELPIYYIFFHKNHEENDKDVLKEIKTTFEKETEQKESTKDKLRKCKDYKQRIITLPWKYGTVKFDGYNNENSSKYDGNHIMIFRYKQDKDEYENNKIVCIQYCIYSLNSNNQLGTYRGYTEEVSDPKTIIELNVEKDLYLKVDNVLTFCNENGHQVDESIPKQLKATINLDDQSFKDEMDKAAKNKIANHLIKD